ncbi:MliC family protein [Niveibacterium sp. SC-1]|uniref:MliC family protein n=1 Tax=Niveibacterium sp. SC-1 TaxID=3135646 RepID=UPI003120202A
MRPALSHPLMLSLLLASAGASAASIDCSKARPDSGDAMVCADESLSALDRTLADVYAQALQLSGPGRKTLLAEERGWIKGQGDCWKTADQQACLQRGYELRIAELQARYQLVMPSGAARYTCPGNKVFHAAFYPTEPASALVTHGKETIFMTARPAASGARYEGPNANLWEHQGEAMIRWGANGTPQTCRAL